MDNLCDNCGGADQVEFDEITTSWWCEECREEIKRIDRAIGDGIEEGRKRGDHGVKVIR